MKVLAFLLAGFAASAGAQEIVTLQTRPGVTLPFFIADMGGRKAEAAALMLIGGGGNIRLRMEDGQVRFGQGNFLPRARREFIRNGILPVILDNPTDQQAGDGMTDAFRESAAHVADIRAVRAEVEKRYPGLPVFIVGTSRSTLSAAHIARSMAGELKGAVLTSSLFHSGKPPESNPCEPLSNHGYFGKEAETVDAIAAWMLGKPFPKDVQ